MKVICQGGNHYDIFDDTLKVYDKLPPQVYNVRFAMQKGFYLQKSHDMEIRESKIYGCHDEKVAKVMYAFSKFDRNLGVILSGAKGIGKSLFAKLLAKNFVDNGMAVLIVDTFYNGIASYIEEVEDNCLVIFDEFDKTFGGIKNEDGKASPEAQMLSLFDGFSTGKKLFVITCNDYRSISQYLINRPGRFHYHFRFEYPTGDEVIEYLRDKLSEEYYGEIDDVVRFAQRVGLNYDCLRAIAFELQNGAKFKDAIKDLNIVNIEVRRYTVTAVYDNGITLRATRVALDLAKSGNVGWIYMNDRNENNLSDISFDLSDLNFDRNSMCYVVDGKYVEENKVEPESSDSESFKKAFDAIRDSKIKVVTIEREDTKSIHYEL